jgi:predicted RNA binding protein YcfA (HicA-like mRNA interferase family)
MSKTQKLLAILASKPVPRDFLWSDFVTLMRHLGYQEHSGAGSRRKFIHSSTKQVISLHEPHPGKELKVYQVKEVVEALKSAGLLQ